MPETAEARRVRVARQPRDQLSHWVAPPSERGKPCPHKCCQNKRVHPSHLPVRLDRAYLRSLSQQDLEREVDTYAHYQDTHEAGFLQLIAEDRRRYESQARAEARKERASDRRRRATEEHRDEVYRQWLQAENATNGYMLNAAGKKAGIDERSLFTGPASRVNKYASPELREWFAQHGRPTREAYTGGRYSRDISY